MEMDCFVEHDCGLLWGEVRDCIIVRGRFVKDGKRDYFSLIILTNYASHLSDPRSGKALLALECSDLGRVTGKWNVVCEHYPWFDRQPDKDLGQNIRLATLLTDGLRSTLLPPVALFLDHDLTDKVCSKFTPRAGQVLARAMGVLGEWYRTRDDPHEKAVAEIAFRRLDAYLNQLNQQQHEAITSLL